MAAAGSFSYGLHSMRQRAAQIGAQLDIRSRLGDGSSVIVTVPPRSDLGASGLSGADLEGR
jgi:signal transduction histidine kinase